MGVSVTRLEDIGLRARVEELESELEETNRRLTNLESMVAKIRALGEEFWREEAAIMLMGAGVSSWRYDARDKNTLFQDVFQCETINENQARRWVGKSGLLGATIAINRTLPLMLAVCVTGFSSAELANTLQLEVDGAPLAWSSRERQTWCAIVPEARSARLKFRISVDTAQLPAEKQVTFSFSEIRIAPLSGGEL